MHTNRFHFEFDRVIPPKAQQEIISHLREKTKYIPGDLELKGKFKEFGLDDERGNKYHIVIFAMAGDVSIFVKKL